MGSGGPAGTFAQTETAREALIWTRSWRAATRVRESILRAPRAGRARVASEMAMRTATTREGTSGRAGSPVSSYWSLSSCTRLCTTHLDQRRVNGEGEGDQVKRRRGAQGEKSRNLSRSFFRMARTMHSVVLTRWTNRLHPNEASLTREPLPLPRGPALRTLDPAHALDRC